MQAGVPAKVIANLMGHTSTRMVDLVYGRVGPSDYEAAIAKLPSGNQSHAGTASTAQNAGTHGTARNAVAQAAIVNSVEESTMFDSSVVPRSELNQRHADFQSAKHWFEDAARCAAHAASGGDVTPS